MYFLCHLSIKPLTCIVFDSDCLKRSYGVYYTVKPGNKTTISNARIIKVFIIRKWNSLQVPFIHIRRVIFKERKVISLGLLYFTFGIFLVQYIKEWSNIAVSITTDWEILPQYLLKCYTSYPGCRSSRPEVLLNQNSQESTCARVSCLI